jgi:putative transposase
VTAAKHTNQALKTVLDRRFVADCRFESKPVFDEDGKLVGTVPNTEGRAYDVHDAHRDAPTGFRLRVNRRVKSYILVQRQGGKVGASLSRPMEGDWPYLWIDATDVKAREAGSIQSVAVIVAVAVNTEGQRQVIGMKVGPSEAETFWTEFLRSLMRRGLRGVKLVISDAHLGLKAAAAKVLQATWQRCRVHFMRNALAHANKTQRLRVSTTIATIFAQDSADAAHAQWRAVADQLRGKLSKLSALMDGAGHEVLSSLNFPRAHWLQIHSTNPLERMNAEIQRRTNVVGILPNDAAVTRLVGAMLLEQNDEWSLNRRYMQLEGLQTLTDTAPTRLPALQR